MWTEFQWELWELERRIYFRKRVKGCQKWRTNPVITDADIVRGNKNAIFRLSFFWGVDLEKELNKLVEPTKPRRGDHVEDLTTKAMGVISGVVYLDTERYVGVQYPQGERLLPYEAFTEYSSKGGTTVWYL